MCKLIVIEGTDCSGKQTQTDMLFEHLLKNNIKTNKFSFPAYDSPTGKIIGGPYLGKDYICDGWFSEGAADVDPKVSALYYAADRRYHLPTLNKFLHEGHLLLDRYTTSNMGHQAGMLPTKEERHKMVKWLDSLEYEALELPRPDITIFLHLPYEYSLELKQNRNEVEHLDELERNKKHLINAENAYLELAEAYGWITINCVKEGHVRSIEDIHNEIYEKIKKELM